MSSKNNQNAKKVQMSEESEKVLYYTEMALANALMVTCARTNKTPAEVLSSGRMQSLIARLKGNVVAIVEYEERKAAEENK